MALNNALTQNPGFFLPGLACKDPLAEYWVSQAMLRLRREICWLRYLSGMPSDAPSIPPLYDGLSISLNMQSFLYEKLEFFKNDKTARYLSEKAEEPPPEIVEANPSALSGVARRLSLDNFDLFVLGLAILSWMDHTAGKIIAAVLNDSSKILPTPALAQSLWDHPETASRLVGNDYVLYRHALLQRLPGTRTDHVWDQVLQIPPLTVRLLTGQTPDIEIFSGKSTASDLPAFHEDPAFFLLNRSPKRLAIIALHGEPGTHYEDFLKKRLHKKVLIATAQNFDFNDPGTFYSLLSTAWLHNADLYIDPAAAYTLFQDKTEFHKTVTALAGLPIRIIAAISDKSVVKAFPPHLFTSSVEIPPANLNERRELWKHLLPKGIADEAIKECSRRFRFEKKTIEEIAQSFQRQNKKPQIADLLNACRTHLKVNMGELAQKVDPRFSGEELILPPKEKEQFNEVITAMRALHIVHDEWQIGKVWSDGGISVLFAGPPGTGKTMASELIAETLQLPIYRIDLSQVVNKYIGETEKNLKRLFDAADQAEVILFFDEADSIFGKRTEVKDAHDRYANLEVSYLLERMERFQGLAILATNRKSDLDSAFLRRLRYTVHFPFPGESERLKIWKQVLPKSNRIETGDLDIPFLANKITLSGGHIRSIVYNASLQCAGMGLKKLTMDAVLTAAKRTYEKINQPFNPETFTAYRENRGGQSR